jgi:hypothetical protein
MNEPTDPRQKAIRRLHQKRAYRHQLQQYLLVNTVLVVLWAATGRGSFWPIWPILGWGAALAVQGWELSHPAKPFSEAEIEREMTQGVR